MDNLQKQKQKIRDVHSLKFTKLFMLEAHSAPTTTSVHADAKMHTLIESSSPSIKALDDGFSDSADIQQFLARKVKIATSVWNVNEHLDLTIFPWEAFIKNFAVERKLDNYGLVKGDLMITITINGTPFHVGMALASYLYLNDDNSDFLVGGISHLVTRSQRPHVYLNPTTSVGGCICVPFFHPLNYIDLVKETYGLRDIGRLDIDSLTILKQLNAGTDRVTVTVFAQLLNAKLAAPTSNEVAHSMEVPIHPMFQLQAQSDEYEDDGVISGPASTIASVAGQLSLIPAIRPLAIATQMAANGIGGMARFFGFSKPTDVCSVKIVRNSPCTDLALCEGFDYSQKLTVTAKQELSIDPGVVGLNETDEMSLSFLTRKESLFSIFEWSTSDLVGSTILALAVTPMVEHRIQVGPDNEVTPTSLSFASRMFEAWSGSLTYRFQFIASQYHRGRIAIVYNPKGSLGNVFSFNECFSTIVDLSEGRDFSITVPYMQGRGYSLMSVSDGAQFASTSSAFDFEATPLRSNGAIYVYVVNELVSPDSTTDVSMAVSIKAGEDFELMNPSHDGIRRVFQFPTATSGQGKLHSMFTLEAHSASEEEGDNTPEGENHVTLVPEMICVPDEKPKMFYGERILSARQLLKRYCLNRLLVNVSADNTDSLLTFSLNSMPPLPGFAPSGEDRTSTNVPYQYNGSTYLSYMLRAYAGWKGSIRHKFMPRIPLGVEAMSVSRMESESGRIFAKSYTPVVDSMNAISGQTKHEVARMVTLSSENVSGTARTQVKQLSVLDVEIPYCLPVRFSQVEKEYSGTAENQFTTGYPAGNSFKLEVSSESASVLIDNYVAAGDDFCLLGFKGAPKMFAYAVPAALP